MRLCYCEEEKVDTKEVIHLKFLFSEDSLNFCIPGFDEVLLFILNSKVLPSSGNMILSPKEVVLMYEFGLNIKHVLAFPSNRNVMALLFVPRNFEPRKNDCNFTNNSHQSELSRHLMLHRLCNSSN